MRRIYFFLITSIIFLYLSTAIESSFAITIDLLGTTTVCLRKQKQRTIRKSGKEYEVWLKDIGSSTLQPDLETRYGTGFLVSHNNKIYLVTAAHVARDMSSEAEVLWNTAAGVLLQTFAEVQQGLPHAKWFFHPAADVAIHPFGFTGKLKPKHSFVGENIFIIEGERLPLGTKIYVLGFPLSLGVGDILSPLSKKAEIASWITTIDDPDINPNLKFILLDEDLAKGYSGAPVFISPEPLVTNSSGRLGSHSRLRLIGILSANISDNTGGKISLVVPVSYLSEIFESNDFRKYERIRDIK
jgi:S1-C subfamily serine protease